MTLPPLLDPLVPVAPLSTCTSLTSNLAKCSRCCSTMERRVEEDGANDDLLLGGGGEWWRQPFGVIWVPISRCETAREIAGSSHFVLSSFSSATFDPQ